MKVLLQNTLWSFFIFCVPCLTLAETPKDESVLFEKISDTVFEQLFSLQRDLSEWGKEQAAIEPQTLGEAWLKLNVCIRAGQDNAACETMRQIREMGEMRDESMSRLVEQIRGLLAQQRFPEGRNVLIKTCFEQFADTVS